MLFLDYLIGTENWQKRERDRQRGDREARETTTERGEGDIEAERQSEKEKEIGQSFKSLVSGAFILGQNEFQFISGKLNIPSQSLYPEKKLIKTDAHLALKICSKDK